MPNSISFTRHAHRRFTASHIHPASPRAFKLHRNTLLLVCLFLLVSISVFKSLWTIDQITLTVPLQRNSIPWWSKSALVKEKEKQSTLLQTEELMKLEERPQHTYRPDGLLEVNFNASHPIPELIKQAEEKWDSKLRQASRTLEEAVEEYKRRYKRMPPINFDIWWDYASSHNILLPDEYDSIYNALEPFWGIAPSTLQSTLDTWSQLEKGGVILFGKPTSYAPIEILRNEVQPEDRREVFASRVEIRMELLEDVEEWIPPFKAVMSPHDNPGILIDWQVKEKALEAAAKGTYMDPDFKLSPKSGWRTACPPSSPAHQSFARTLNEPYDGPFEFLPSSSSRTRKAFIHNHALSTSICNHPTHLISHSQFLNHGNGGPSPRPLPGIIPQFSNCASELHADLVVVPAQTYDEFDGDLEWERKVDERVLWRGSTTGMWHGDVDGKGKELWRQAQRERFVNLTNIMPGTVGILRPSESSSTVDEKAEMSLSWEPVGEPEEWPAAWMNAALMDVAFAGEPIQCEGKGCDALRRGYEWRYKMGYENSKKYKYVVDIDGNGWSSRFRRLLSSNSLIFKSTIYPEWFSDRIQEWVHYVPILSDYSDLYDSVVFFRGDLKGEGRHDNSGKKIAEAGAWWTRNVWRREDMVAYMFRYMLEYARVMSLDRDALTYEPPMPETTSPNDDSNISS